jgi:hypothetical protein
MTDHVHHFAPAAGPLKPSKAEIEAVGDLARASWLMTCACGEAARLTAFVDPVGNSRRSVVE